jgi:hypothetical protein
MDKDDRPVTGFPLSLQVPAVAAGTPPAIGGRAASGTLEAVSPNRDTAAPCDGLLVISAALARRENAVSLEG